jgi:hypothetical protein
MPTPRLRFRARIELNGFNPYVLAGATRAARLKAGRRKPIPVRITVNGKPDAASLLRRVHYRAKAEAAGRVSG